MFKADYILGIDEADMVENMNKPEIAKMNKVAENMQTNDNLVGNENVPIQRELIASTDRDFIASTDEEGKDEEGNNDQKIIRKSEKPNPKVKKLVRKSEKPI